MHNKQKRGFTLVELLVTLAIASILAGIATPSLIEMISNSRLTSTTNEFLGALSYARSEAVKRGIPVTVLNSDNRPAAGNWSAGWDIFADANGDNTFHHDIAIQCLPMDDCLLRSHEAIPSGYTLLSGNKYDLRITFLPSGQIDPGLGGGDTFTLCDGTHDDKHARLIRIISSGRARLDDVIPNGTCP